MESVGAFFPDSEWDYFRKMFASEEHDYYSPQFLTQCSLMFGGEDDELNIATQFCSAPEAGENECMFYSLDAHNSNSHHISQENSYSSNCTGDTVFNSNPGHTNYFLNYPDHVVLENNTCVPLDEKNIASFVPSVTDIVMEENVKLNEDVGSDNNHSSMEPIAFPTKQLQLKRKLAEDQIDNRSENQKKKARVLKDGQGCMKNARSKKNQKLVSNGEESEETNNTGSNGQSSSSNISEDDNASQENSGGATSGSKSALNSNGKTRASRGSATDPQSLYARKRRERINERLRILQNLVPNGTKVDISTMLEEAVNYVKFLQLQIKLLSSDDLWMYAPLAYNGLDIGLNLNMKSSLPL